MYEGGAHRALISVNYGSCDLIARLIVMATSDSELIQLDFVQGDVCYALKRHDPEPGRHAKGCAPSEVKEEVLASPRMQRVMQEV